MSKIILMANDKPGVLIAKFLKESGDNIVRLYLHDESARKLSDDIINNAGCNEIFYAKDLKDKDHISTIPKLDADFIITVYWGYLLSPEVFNAVKDTVNFHPAYLPINRGWYPHVHSMIDGSMLGVTLHRVDDGADTGPIWVQKKVELSPYDTAKTIYDRLQLEIVELFQNNWGKIKSGVLDPIPQDNSKAVYHKKKELENLDCIDLENKIKIKDLINLLKARSFGNLGFAFYNENGKNIYLNLRLSDSIHFDKDEK
jgi:methionyl-tRNA formyltransferase